MQTDLHERGAAWSLTRVVVVGRRLVVDRVTVRLLLLLLLLLVLVTRDRCDASLCSVVADVTVVVAGVAQGMGVALLRCSLLRLLARVLRALTAAARVRLLARVLTVGATPSIVLHSDNTLTYALMMLSCFVTPESTHRPLDRKCRAGAMGSGTVLTTRAVGA